MQPKKTRPLRLLIINQSFYPDYESVGQLMTELAEDLVKNDLEVQVLTAKGRCSKSLEIYKGISINRVFQAKFPKNRLLGRYINYVSLFGSFLLKGIFIKKPDVLLFASSPPFLNIIAILLGKIRGAKLVYCIQDLFPEVAVELGLLRNLWLVRILDYLTRLSYQLSDRIVVICADMRERLIKKGVDPKKIILIANWADANNLFPIPKNQTTFYRQNRTRLENKFVVQYSGNMGLAHEFSTILGAAEALQTSNDNIIFAFIGGGVQQDFVRREADKRGLGNLIFFPYQAKDSINQSLNACDLSLVSLKSGFEGLIVPSKIYGILAVAKPVVFIGNKKSEIGQIIINSGCGYSVAIGDVKGLVVSILRLYNDPSKAFEMGKNGRKTVVNSFTRKLSVDKYYDALINI